MDEDILKGGVFSHAPPQFFNRACHGKAAVVDDGDLGAEAADLIHEVGGKYDGFALGGFVFHEVVEGDGAFDVEAIGRLIEDEKPGLMEEGEDKAEFFLHATGVVVGELAEGAGHLEAIDEGGEAGHGGGNVEAVEGGAEFEDFQAGEVGVKDGFVGEKAHEALEVDPGIEGVPAVDAKGAGGGAEDTHEQAEESGLAGAVGAEEAEDLAARNLEGDVGQGFLGTKGFGQMLDLNDSFAHRAGSCASGAGCPSLFGLVGVLLGVISRLMRGSGMNTVSLKRRILWVVGLWVAGLAAGSAMFLLTDAPDRDYYWLAVSLFPTGLMVPLLPWLDHGLPQFVTWGLWTMYVAASGWLLAVRQSKIFWYGLAGLGLIVVLNIGGCAYVIHH